MSLAFVFPGQGSQSVGMLAEMAETYPLVQETFGSASEVLGFDLWNLVQEGPAEELNQTHITQPAMLSAGVAVWRIWQEKGGATPAVMAGHSLGEYSALVAAGAIQFEDAVAVVADRGRFMQEAVPAGEGAMAAILGLDDDKVVSICTNAAMDEVVSAVNFNSPGQVVVAGSSAAVDRAVSLAKEEGAKRALKLPVSVPSHCALMIPAAEKLATRLNDITISAPAIPVINNVDVVATDNRDDIRDALVRQLHNPVRWVETVLKMSGDGVDKLFECGPGKVLVGLNKRIDRNMAASALFDVAGLEQALNG